jgi:hypothetical protein
MKILSILLAVGALGVSAGCAVVPYPEPAVVVAPPPAVVVRPGYRHYHGHRYPHRYHRH